MTLYLHEEVWGDTGGVEVDYRLASRADRLRADGWVECPDQECVNGYLTPPDDPEFDIDIRCLQCADGLVPSVGILDAAFDAYWRHLPDHMDMRSDVHVRALRAALVAAARKERE